MITPKELRAVLIQIVKGWPYDKDNPWKRLNTFATLESRSDWSAKNFNKTDKDVLSHEYWSRSQGKRMSGYLVWDHTQSRIKNLGSGDDDTMCIMPWLTVAFEEKKGEYCPWVPEIGKSDLYDHSVEVLRQIVLELHNWGKYEICDLDSDGNPIDHSERFVWTTEGAIACNKKIGKKAGCAYSLKNYLIENKNVQVHRQELGSYGLIGSSVQLKIDGCSRLEPVDIDYCKEECPERGIVVCEVC